MGQIHNIIIFHVLKHFLNKLLAITKSKKYELHDLRTFYNLNYKNNFFKDYKIIL